MMAPTPARGLAHERVETYDASYHEDRHSSAVESVSSPLGWDRTRIRRSVAGSRERNLATFVDADEADERHRGRRRTRV